MTIENNVAEIKDVKSKPEEIESSQDKIVNETIGLDYSAHLSRYEIERKEFRKRMYLFFTFLTAFSILIFASFNNPDLYKIDKQTLLIINQAFNAIVLLVIPFLLGSLGATARILMAGVKAGQQGVLIVSSGLMAMFSWVGIKSGVLLAIVAPHLEKQGIPNQITAQSETNFYTMALVAILVGMFSSNLYIFVNQRVEQLLAKQSPNKKINKNNKDTHY